jgi:hypothetical protein
MNLIPPQGARMLGAWPNGPEPQRRHGRPDRSGSSDRAASAHLRVRLARVLHPLRRSVELPAAEPAPTPPVTARHA